MAAPLLSSVQTAAAVSVPPPLPTTATTTATSTAHVVLLPFMSKGHTIPLLHLASLLLRRGMAAAITIFTTPANSPFIRSALATPQPPASATINVLELPFPENFPGLPHGAESTDKLPSMSLFLTFIQATKLLQPHFEQALSSSPPPSAIIYDGFLPWAQEAAEKLGVPSLVFTGMNITTMVVVRLVLSHPGTLRGVKSEDEPFSVPFFPSVRICQKDLGEPFRQPEPKGPLFDFVMESSVASERSSGFLVNSFYELERAFVDFYCREFKPRVWCIGPLCAASSPLKRTTEKPVGISPATPPRWMQWLDRRKELQRDVLYVAFGTQAEVSPEQLAQIGIGLERSGVDFLWVVRGRGAEEAEEGGSEERRGLVVREWVDQRQILDHPAVEGFLSHCGWNSVLESICAAVPLLAWPMMAEQHLNAKLAVEALGIGFSVLSGAGDEALVGWERVREVVVEMMAGERGAEARKKVKEVGEAAGRAVEEGGSSWNALGLMVEEVICRRT